MPELADSAVLVPGGG